MPTCTGSPSSRQRTCDAPRGSLCSCNGSEQWPLLPRQSGQRDLFPTGPRPQHVRRQVPGLGSIRNRIGSFAVPGYPLVIVTGTVGLGTFVARRERFYERWGRGRRGEGAGLRELLR